MRSQMKAYYYCFLFWGKKSDFLFKNLKFLQKIYFFTSNFFRVRTEGEIFQKVLVRFQQTRSQMKANYYCFLFWGQKFDLKKLKFSQKMYFLPAMVPKVKYFKKFSSDFNKQGLKWKLITTASYFEEIFLIFFPKN